MITKVYLSQSFNKIGELYFYIQSMLFHMQYYADFHLN